MEKITIKRRNNISLNLEVDDLTQVSDGYHTIAELYDHRITLYIALCRQLKWSGDLCGCDAVIPIHDVWRSKTHGDGNPAYEGWFILGINKEPGHQISYHIPLERWEDTSFADTLDKAPEWDGHTSADVLERLKSL